MTITSTVPGTAFDALKARLHGRLVRPRDADYDAVRAVFNAMIDRRPAAVVQCLDPADVARGIAFAREHDLVLSVRGGGHNVAGHAVCDGGVMLDLSVMKGLRVDPDGQVAHAGAGLTLGELDRATPACGLATPLGVVSVTGIAGLTLGGGLGSLNGRYGLTCDNLIAAEVVTADGQLVHVSQDEHPDLFWALRGGGGNFGVVTSFVYRLHPVGQVIGGLAVHPFTAAKEVLTFYRDFTRSLPDELTVFAALTHAPDGSGAKIAALAVCHVGPTEQADADLAPVRAFGEPLMVEIGLMPYPVMNTLLDDAFPKGALNYWKANFVETFDDGLIDVVVEQFAAVPSPMSAILFEHLHGEVTRVPVESAAVAQRDEGYNLLIPGVWMDPAE